MMQRRKGKTGERELVRLLRARGFPAKRTWETAQAGDTRANCDVEVCGIRIQVKRRKRGFQALYKALEGVDAACIRQDGQNWLVLINLDDYLTLAFVERKENQEA